MNEFVTTSESRTVTAHEIFNKITKLSSFPKKHALIDEEPWRTEGVRKIVIKNFLIYYWVDDENNRVQVTTVIYSRRDQIRQLSNMDME